METLISDFSSFKRLIRVIAFVLLWLRAIQSALNEHPSGRLSAKELEAAELCIIAAVQSHHFTEEIASIHKGKINLRSSPIKRLLPFLDDRGVLRVRSRLEYSSLSFDEKHPILLPK